MTGFAFGGERERTAAIGDPSTRYGLDIRRNEPAIRCSGTPIRGLPRLVVVEQEVEVVVLPLKNPDDKETGFVFELCKSFCVRRRATRTFDELILDGLLRRSFRSIGRCVVRKPFEPVLLKPDDGVIRHRRLI